LGLFCHFLTDSPALRQVFDVSGLEHVEKSKALGHGLIFFTGHLGVGAWELTSCATALLGHPFTVIARRLDNPKIEQLVERARTRCGNRTIIWEIWDNKSKEQRGD